MEEAIDAIIAAVRDVLERTPPELAADIMSKGVVMTGGGSWLTLWILEYPEKPD
jgi:rod shape-determining protein MreB